MIQGSLKKICLAVLLLSLANESAAAEKTLTPSIALSEEYIDNIFATERNREEDYITRVIPGLSGHYKAARLELDASYLFDYRYFAKQRHSPIETHKLTSGMLAELASNRLYLKLSDSYDRVSLDPTIADRPRESLFLNQTEANVFLAEPYLVMRPGNIEITAGYRYLNYWYKEESAVDKRDHSTYLKVGGALSDETSWHVQGEHLEEMSSAADFTKDSAWAGFTHQFGSASVISASAGTSRLEFDEGRSYSNIFWNASIAADLGIAKGELSTAARLNENPRATPQWEYTYSAALSRELSRSALKLTAYLADYENSETEAFETRKYGSSFHFGHKFSERAEYALTASLEKFEKKLLRSQTVRVYLEQAFRYSLSEGTSASLEYILVGYDSHTIPEDNYITNRFIAEIRKVF